MNTIAATILWMSVQIGLFSLVGFATFVLLRRRGPSAAAACCALVLGLTLPLAAMVVSPWPRWSLGAASKPAVSEPCDSIAVELRKRIQPGDDQKSRTIVDGRRWSRRTIRYRHFRFGGKRPWIGFATAARRIRLTPGID